MCALLESINDHFSELDDPRRATKNQCHEFIDILVIALCGAICGAIELVNPGTTRVANTTVKK